VWKKQTDKRIDKHINAAEHPVHTTAVGVGKYFFKNARFRLEYLHKIFK